MDMRITTIVHNGTVYTIGSRETLGFGAESLRYIAEVSVANGQGISYKNYPCIEFETEDEAILNAVNAILEYDPVHSYVVSEVDGGFGVHFRTLDGALATVDRVDRDLIIAEV